MVFLKRKKNSMRGFTLIELLIVLAIISILAAVVAPSAFRAVENAKISKAITDVNAFQKATLAYYTDVGSFPKDIGPGMDPGFNTISAIHNWQGPYLDMGAPSGRLPKNPWGGKYDYELWESNESSSNWQKSVAGVWISIRGIPNSDIAEKLIQKGNLNILQGDPSDDNSYSDPKFLKVSFRIVKFNN